MRGLDGEVHAEPLLAHSHHHCRHMHAHLWCRGSMRISDGVSIEIHLTAMLHFTSLHITLSDVKSTSSRHFSLSHLKVVGKVEYVHIDHLVHYIVHTDAASKPSVRPHVCTLHPFPWR